MMVPFTTSHPLIDELFITGNDISEEKLQAILSLPRKELITDLEKTLLHCINAYDSFKDMEDSDWNNETFPIHAMFLLAELKAEESLPVFLNLLEQDEDILHFWFGDHITENFWQNIFMMGQNQLETLYNFVATSSSCLWSKIAVIDGVAQMAIHLPEKRQEVIKWQEKLLDELYSRDKEHDDYELNTSLLSSIIDIGAIELSEKAKLFHDEDRIDEFVYGKWDGFLKYMNKPIEEKTRTILPIKKRYFDFYEKDFGNDFIEEDDSFDNDDFDGYKNNRDDGIVKGETFTRTEPKTGRNDPCPCGSGKKYKKCCLE